MPKITATNPNPASNSQQAKTPRPDNKTLSTKFYQKRFFIVALSLVLLVLIIGGSIFLSTYPQKKPVTAEQNGNNSSSLAAIEYKDLSKPIDTENLKELADKRIKQLTNNLNIKEIEELKTTHENTKEQPQYGDGGSQFQNSIINQTDPTNTENFIKQKNINDDTIFYFEDEIKGEFKENTYQVPTANTNKEQPILKQSWYSANYYKSILSQNGKILQQTIQTPTYQFNYLGAEYALKENYPQKNFFNGLQYNNGVNLNNSYITPLKNLNNESFKFKVTQQQVDGRNLQVIEQESKTENSTANETANLKPDDSTERTLYYIDSSNFTLYLTETYRGSNLITTSKNLKSQSTRTNPDNVFNYKEFDKKVWEFDLPDTSEDTKLAEVINKYPIFYVNDNFTDYPIYISSNSQFENRDLETLRYKREFNPSLSDEVIKSRINSVIANFSQFAQEHTNFTIYGQKPNKESSNTKVSNIKQVNVNIDGQNITGETFSLDSLDSEKNVLQGSTNNILEFNFKDIWYELIIGDKPYSGLNLKTLNRDQAKAIDDRQQEIQNSTVVLNTVNQSEIPNNQLLLLDKDSPQQDLQLNKILKSKKSGDQSTCDKYKEVLAELSNCLIEKYNGYSTYYTNDAQIKQNPSSAYKFLDIAILNTKLKDIPIDEYTEQINQYIKIASPKTELNTIIKSDKFYTIKQLSKGVDLYLVEKNGQTIMLFDSNKSLNEEIITKYVQSLQLQNQQTNKQ